MFAKAAILSDEMIATDAAAYTEQKQDRILRAYAGTGDEEDKSNLHLCGLKCLDEVE